MRKRGAATLLVTGGFHDFADPLAAELGFQEVRANHLESMYGHLTGKVTGEIVDAAAKAQALTDRRDQLGVARGEVLAVGLGGPALLLPELHLRGTADDGRREERHRARLHPCAHPTA